MAFMYVPKACAEQASEIEITPEMIEAGVRAFRQFERETNFLDDFSPYDEDVEKLIVVLYSSSKPIS